MFQVKARSIDRSASETLFPMGHINLRSWLCNRHAHRNNIPCSKQLQAVFTHRAMKSLLQSYRLLECRNAVISTKICPFRHGLVRMRVHIAIVECSEKLQCRKHIWLTVT